MSATARRRFLTGLTAAVAAPAAIAAPVAAAAVTRGVTEMPGLLAVGRQLLEAEIEFDAAAAATEAAQFEFKKLRPPLGTEPRTALGVASLASAYLIGRKIATPDGHRSGRLDLIGATLANEVRLRNAADLRDLLQRADS